MATYPADTRLAAARLPAELIEHLFAAHSQEGGPHAKAATRVPSGIRQAAAHVPADMRLKAACVPVLSILNIFLPPTAKKGARMRLAAIRVPAGMRQAAAGVPASMRLAAARVPARMRIVAVSIPAEHVEHLVAAHGQEGGPHALDIRRVDAAESNQQLRLADHLVGPFLLVEVGAKGVGDCVRRNLVTVSIQVLHLKSK